MNRRASLIGLALALSGSIWVFAAGRTDQPGAEAITGFAPNHAEAERALEQNFRSVPDQAHSEAILRHLTSEPHMAGTEASHRVALWLRDQYRSLGFDAEIVTYNAWLPIPREAQLELVAPERKILGSSEQPLKDDPDSYDRRIRPAFNAYSPSGEVTAPVVYVNYGQPEDYRELAALGGNAEGKIVMVRYGHGFRGVKVKLAEEHKALGVIIFSDPDDDGGVRGEVDPEGPWRPGSGIQRGSILYTQVYPGDPLTAGPSERPGSKRLAPAEAANLPHIPAMPVNAADAAAILAKLGGPSVPHNWQGGLPFTYHAGLDDVKVHMKLAMDYAERPVYNVIAKLHGSNDNEWVLLGNHHDAWVFGAADPGSGTTAMLEAARSLGTLAKSGWKPKRTIVICEWDAEEPGLVGSTAWVEANLAELREKAVAYINTDVGVTGPNFTAAATPSLKQFVRAATRPVDDPSSGKSVYDAWREHVANRDNKASGTARQPNAAEYPGEVPVGDLGAGSDFCPFFDYAGIPSIDVGFEGDYGVYHSAYDDFYWMKHFGDPTFSYHAALARVIGTLALRLDEADVLPFDYSTYGREVSRAAARVSGRAVQAGYSANLDEVAQAAEKFRDAAARESDAIASTSLQSNSPADFSGINRELVRVEQALLDPEGLAGRPWFKHTIYAPGSYSGYAAQVLPGVNEALDRNDRERLRAEATALASALRRATECLDDISARAQGITSDVNSGH